MIVPRVRSLNANLRLISAIVSAVYLLKITEIKEKCLQSVKFWINLSEQSARGNARKFDNDEEMLFCNSQIFETPLDKNCASKPVAVDHAKTA
jgi:hypothetical protein